MLRRTSVALALVIAAAGCGDGGSKTPSASDSMEGTSAPTTADPTTTARQPLKPVELSGPVTVVAIDYPLPNETGWETAVAFRVHNPNAQSVFSVPFRVELSAGTAVAFTSDGQDTVSLRAGETRLVVFTGGDPKGARPTAAKVTLYGPLDEPGGGSQEIADSTKWQVASPRIDCTGGTVACEMTGDLTWTGDKPQRGIQIQVVIHAGSNGGPIIGAGEGSPRIQTAQPNQLFPFSLSVIVDEAHRADARKQPEIVVSSLDA